MALDKKLRDHKKALQRLEEAIDKTRKNKSGADYSFFRDSAIQRFEFTLEISWKSIKQFLLEHDGIECRSPKGCLREFFSAGYIDEEQISQMLLMIDDRNLATHTYHESLADDIYEHIENYLLLLKHVYEIVGKPNYLSF